MKTSYYRHLNTTCLIVLDLVPYVVDAAENTYLITRINVPNRKDANGKPYRGNGHASELLRLCLKDADAEGATLLLEVSPSDGLSFDELVAWYVRYGFKQHREHNLWIRLPRLPR